ncbi:hypothetical protein GGR52DRAFT_521336 [Hypoxylon sp. FL1284]|nr:hypothetical protein GGR52DRAFT_521336 [Hypoxylon sp. FL1284]
MAGRDVATVSKMSSKSEIPTHGTHGAYRTHESPLLWLPCELLVHTASYLSPDDFFSLRLTCHRVEAYLFASFSEEFFSDRRFMITDYSLRCLLDISKHPHLSKCLSKLTIGLDRLQSSDALHSSGFRDGEINRPHVKRGINPHKLEELAIEQTWLVSSGEVQLLLGEALANLPNVIEINLRDASAAKEYSRPGSHQLVVSYGTAAVRRQTGIDLLGDNALLHSQDRFADVVFSAALLAAARSGKQLKVITANILKQDTGFSSSAFLLPEKYMESFGPALQTLHSLDLSVTFTHSAVGSLVNGSLGFLHWQRHHLFSLLERTPNLASLRIRSKGQSVLEDGMIGWLACLADVPNGKPISSLRSHGPTGIAQTHGFRALRELELGSMIARTASISKALLYFAASLRQLHLHTVAVSVTRDDEELNNNPRNPNAWTCIFREMAESLSLEEFRVCSLGHQTPTCSTNGNRHQVAFLKSKEGAQSGPRNGLLNAWSYAGGAVAMKSFLLEVAEKTVIICASCRVMNVGYLSFEDTVGE